MVVYNPVSPADADRIRSLIDQKSRSNGHEHARGIFLFLAALTVISLERKIVGIHVCKGPSSSRVQPQICISNSV
jgi:hypothetical protein